MHHILHGASTRCQKQNIKIQRWHVAQECPPNTKYKNCNLLGYKARVGGEPSILVST